MNYIPNKIKKELQKYPPERKERFLKYYGKFISSYYFEANMIVFLLFLLVINNNSFYYSYSMVVAELCACG